jgi:hypothetical protein
MTDAAAQIDLERAIKWGIFGSPPSVETMEYALRAIRERAALVALVEKRRAAVAEATNAGHLLYMFGKETVEAVKDATSPRPHDPDEAVKAIRLVSDDMERGELDF